MRGKETEQKILETWVRNISDSMREGNKLKTACRLLKIPYQTMLDYREKSEWVRAEFELAEASFEAGLIQSVKRDALENGKLALDVLSRIDKDRFSTRQEMTGKQGEDLFKNEATGDYLEFLKEQNRKKALKL